MNKIVSIDIETTGIDDRSEILQISAAVEDASLPISKLTILDMPIKHEHLDYCEPYALGMNAELLKKLMDKSFQTYTPQVAIQALINLLSSVNGGNRVILAGKNVASFDIPKLEIFIKKYDPQNLEVFKSLVHYKTLDVGSMYYDVFGDNVSLSKINALTGRPPVSHNALDDALDVIYAIRHKMNIPF